MGFPSRLQWNFRIKKWREWNPLVKSREYLKSEDKLRRYAKQDPKIQTLSSCLKRQDRKCVCCEYNMTSVNLIIKELTHIKTDAKQMRQHRKCPINEKSTIFAQI